MRTEELEQVAESESLRMLERAHVRHVRRIRNQIISYSVVVILLGAAVFGTYVGGTRLIGVIAERRVAAEMAAEAEAAERAEEEAAETENDMIVISEPETIDTSEEQETTEAPAVSDEELLEGLISEVIAGMSLKDKVAGMFIATPEQFTDVDVAIKAGDGTEEALQNTAIGGLVYAGKNIKTTDQIREMLSKTKDMSKYPIFLATTEAGGETGCLTESLSLEPVYPPAILAENGETDAAYEVGAEIAKRMVDVGFTVDLAPCANLTTEAMSSEEREMSFGSDPSVASALLASEIRGLEENGVHSLVKMFPVSAAKNDSNIPTTKESVQSLQDNEFKMFAAAIEAGTKMIMVGNLAAPEIVGDNTPCTMSSIIITDQLRGALGFSGVVITDAMDDPVITDYYTSDQAAIAAIKAGADMIYRPENLEEALNGVVDAVNSGTLPEDRINESLTRIFRVKYAGRIETSISAN